MSVVPVLSAAEAAGWDRIAREDFAIPSRVLMESAGRLGAGLDWKTSLQELTATHGLGVPEYSVEEEGPDHAKTFHAVVKVGGTVRGRGSGRSKKEAEQQAAATAFTAITAELDGTGPASGGTNGTGRGNGTGPTA